MDKIRTLEDKNNYVLTGPQIIRLFMLHELDNMPHIRPIPTESMEEVYEVMRTAPLDTPEPQQFAQEQDWYKALAVMRRWNPDNEFEPFVICRKHYNASRIRNEAVYLYQRFLDGQISIYRFTIAKNMLDDPAPWDRRFLT